MYTSILKIQKYKGLQPHRIKPGMRVLQGGGIFTVESVEKFFGSTTQRTFYVIYFKEAGSLLVYARNYEGNRAHYVPTVNI